MSGAHASGATNRQAALLFSGTVALLLVGLFFIFGGFNNPASGAPGDPLPPKSNAKIKGVDPEAQGVNEGDKKQGENIKMKTVPQIDNEAVAGKYGKFGGCVEGYGKGKACLAPVSPDAVAMGMNAQEHPWNCLSVRKWGFPDGIALNDKSKDALKLDTNKDGVACGSGD